ncbi:MAG: hypothetical protein AAF517_01950 [Planctomycetota bacterium]
MENYPTRWTYEEHDEDEDQEQAAHFLLNVISATIYSSGEDYDRALEEFFTQVEALGRVIGAESVDEVSAFMRRTCRPL